MHGMYVQSLQDTTMASFIFPEPSDVKGQVSCIRILTLDWNCACGPKIKEQVHQKTPKAGPKKTITHKLTSNSILLTMICLKHIHFTTLNHETLASYLE